jgi:hypothetical protein
MGSVPKGSFDLIQTVIEVLCYSNLLLPAVDDTHTKLIQ